mgnify:CR=1 FL=1
MAKKKKQRSLSDRLIDVVDEIQEILGDLNSVVEEVTLELEQKTPEED